MQEIEYTVDRALAIFRVFAFLLEDDGMCDIAAICVIDAELAAKSLLTHGRIYSTDSELEKELRATLGWTGKRYHQWHAHSGTKTLCRYCMKRWRKS